MTLVTTDHADPLYQSRELEGISGEYGFEFVSLIMPGSKGNETAPLAENEDIEVEFTIKDVSTYVYYYLAHTKSSLRTEPYW